MHQPALSFHSLLIHREGDGDFFLTQLISQLFAKAEPIHAVKESACFKLEEMRRSPGLVRVLGS
jgi:hypothetical protein